MAGTRNILASIAGDVTNIEVAGNNPEFKALIEMLTGKTLEGYKMELAAKKRKLKEQLDLIPARIDEAKRSMPQAIDEAAINKDIEDLEQIIESIENQMTDANQAYNEAARSQSDLRIEVNTINGKIQTAEFSIKQKFNDDRNNRKTGIISAENDLKGITSARNQYISSKTRIDNRIESLTAQRLNLRSQWEKINAEVFTYDPNQFVCPTCKRDLDAANVETQKSQLENNFNEDKQRRLNDISNKGLGMSTEIQQLEQELKELGNGRDFDRELATAQNTLDELKFKDTQENSNEEKSIETAIKNNPEIFTLKAELKNKQAEIDATSLAPVDNTSLKIRVQQKRNELSDLKTKLNNKEAIERVTNRIKELEEQEKTQGQELADLEKTEFTIAQFTKARIDLIESRINGKFHLVTFKIVQQNNRRQRCGNMPGND